MGRQKRIVRVSVLPGEPLDGSGRVCIHFLLRDERGPFVEPSALHPKFDECGNRVKKELVAKPTRMRLACDPRRTVAPAVRRGITTITHRTEEPSAVTCPKCIASVGYAQVMELLESRAAGSGEAR